MEQKKIGISKALRFGYGSCGFLNTLSVSFKIYYWTYFLTTIVALPLGAVGVMNTAINMFDLVGGFFWAAVIDAMGTGKWGKYRTIMFIFAPIQSLLHIAQWFGPSIYAFGGSVTIAVIIGFIAFALYIVAYNILWLCDLSIPTFTAKNEEERSILAGTNTIWNAIPGLIISYVSAFLISLFANEVVGYAAAASIMGMLTIPGYYIHARLIKDYEWTADEMKAAGVDPKPKKAKGDGWKVIAMTFKVLFTNGQLLLTTLVNTCATLASFLWSYMGVYLFQMTLDAADFYATYITITNFAGIIGAFISNILTKKVANKKLVIIGYSGTALMMVVAKIAVSNLNAALFTVAMVIARIFCAIAAPSMSTFYTNCAVYEQYRTHENRTPNVMSCPNISVKIALVAIAVIVPAVLAATGYDATSDVVTEATKTALANWYTVVPCIVYALGAILIAFLFKLDRKTVDGYLEEIRKNPDEFNKKA